MRFLVIILCLFLSLTSLVAQSMSDAERLFNSGKYDEAYQIYTSLLSRNPNDTRLKYRLGRCLLALKLYDKSIPYFEYAAKKKFYKSYYFLYEAYYATYSFDKAIESIDLYIDKADLTDYAKEISYELREKAVVANRMLGAVEDIIIEDSVRMHKNQMLCVYDLTTSLGSIFYDCNDSVAQRVGYQTGRKDKKIVSVYRDTILTLAVSYKLLEEWGDTTFLSDVINSDSDVNYPFEMPDGVTLYFSSKGHESIGGYDIFMSRFNSSSNDYAKPLNIGMPFNSPANDYMLVIDDLKRCGWFATDRYQHPDSVVIYKFIPNEVNRKIDTSDIDYRKAVAQLKVYRKLESVHNGVEKEVEENVQHSANSQGFIVSDDIIYKSEEQFRNVEAKQLYIDLQKMYKRRSTLLILVEGKRIEYMVSGREQDRDLLRQEVVKLEHDLMQLNEDIKDTVYKIRFLELSFIGNK